MICSECGHKMTWVTSMRLRFIGKTDVAWFRCDHCYHRAKREVSHRATLGTVPTCSCGSPMDWHTADRTDFGRQVKWRCLGCERELVLRA